MNQDKDEADDRAETYSISKEADDNQAFQDDSIEGKEEDSEVKFVETITLLKTRIESLINDAFYNLDQEKDNKESSSNLYLAIIQVVLDTADIDSLYDLSAIWPGLLPDLDPKDQIIEDAEETKEQPLSQREQNRKIKRDMTAVKNDEINITTLQNQQTDASEYKKQVAYAGIDFQELKKTQPMAMKVLKQEPDILKTEIGVKRRRMTRASTLQQLKEKENNDEEAKGQPLAQTETICCPPDSKKKP